MHLGNILHHIKSKIPPVLKISLILYTYTTPIATEIFIYKNLCVELQDLNIDDFKSKPPDSNVNCASSPFIYNPTGDHNITNNTSLRDMFDKGPKYREPKSINWKHNFKILMYSVEDYARQ